MNARLSELTGLLLTAAIAIIAGLLCRSLGAPAPFLLGSLFGVWISGVACRPLRARLGVPRWFQMPVIVGLGVLMGAMFDPEIIHDMSSWLSTVLAMAAATVLATVVGFAYLTRIRGYEKTLALLCCLPGGQAEVVVVSRELVEKDYVVALCHLARVATVFCATPFVLTAIHGEAAVAASNEVLANLPGILELGPENTLHFIGTAVVGYLIARLIRLPMPHLLGPLLLSSFLHMTGILSIPRISEFVLIAQIAIGGAIGARLSQVPARELAGYLRDAVANSVLLVSVYTLTAIPLAYLMSRPVTDLFLAFIPGGLYEVTLLALLFGFDVAFVTFHHTIRVLMIFFMLPALISIVHKKRV